MAEVAARFFAEALTGVSSELAQLSREMERAEEKSQQMQARAAAIDRLVNEGWLELPNGQEGYGESAAVELAIDLEVEAQLASLRGALAG